MNYQTIIVKQYDHGIDYENTAFSGLFVNVN